MYTASTNHSQACWQTHTHSLLNNKLILNGRFASSTNSSTYPQLYNEIKNKWLHMNSSSFFLCPTTFVTSDIQDCYRPFVFVLLCKSSSCDRRLPNIREHKLIMIHTNVPGNYLNITYLNMPRNYLSIISRPEKS